MNRNKLIIVILGVILIVGGFFIATQRKQTPADLPSEKQTTEGAPVMTEGAKKEMKEESYVDGISLTITSPQSNATVTSSTVVVKGKTSPQAEVFVNDSETKADANGNFAVTITLDQGENPIVVVSNDAEGNSAEQQILVTLSE